MPEIRFLRTWGTSDIAAFLPRLGSCLLNASDELLHANCHLPAPVGCFSLLASQTFHPTPEVTFIPSRAGVGTAWRSAYFPPAALNDAGLEASVRAQPGRRE